MREITKHFRTNKLIDEEELPGDGVETDEDLKAFVRKHAWGHHASCSCAIGKREDQGVLTSDFRVHGTTSLRVVDASVFPRIPGFFIASAIYMIGEKAAEEILAADEKKLSRRMFLIRLPTSKLSLTTTCDRISSASYSYRPRNISFLVLQWKFRRLRVGA